MNVYSDLKQAQLEKIASTSQNVAKTGLIFLDTLTGVPLYSDGTSFRPLGSGGSAAASVIWQLQDNSPTLRQASGVEYLDFDNLLEQEMWTAFSVPADYVSGTQILLKGGKVVVPDAANLGVGSILFKATSYLIKPSAGSVDNRTQSWKSLNAKVTSTSVIGQLLSLGDIDLTSTTGAVKKPDNTDVLVAAGDLLIIKLAREVQSEATSVSAAVSFVRNSMTAKFSA